MRLASRAALLWIVFAAGIGSMIAGIATLTWFSRLPRGQQNCAFALGALGFTGLGFLLMILMLALIPWASRTIWEADVAGHRIRIVNRAFRETLIVDDRVVDEHHGFSFGTTLRATQPLQIEVKIGGMLSIKCRCTVDGQPIELREV